MSVAQTGQHTTGHNIANVDTEGFSRQEVVQETAMPAVAGKGQGAEVQTIRRIQDGFTKDKVVGEQTQVGSWNTREKVLKEVEAIYTDLEGNKLRKELQSRKVLNANVLDYLLAHPELIPEEWKGKCLFFWGTIYRRSNGHLYVRFLYWFGDRWRWVGGWLDDGWRGNDPAVLSAS